MGTAECRTLYMSLGHIFLQAEQPEHSDLLVIFNILYLSILVLSVNNLKLFVALFLKLNMHLNNLLLIAHYIFYL